MRYMQILFTLLLLSIKNITLYYPNQDAITLPYYITVYFLRQVLGKIVRQCISYETNRLHVFISDLGC